ncbi:MAG: hypothetical protein DWI00_18085 [Planctomycetota bacterium]|nr:MAG: hypothetical protein DWI00_18085 [Planctomycetota bacterium]
MFQDRISDEEEFVGRPKASAHADTVGCGLPLNESISGSFDRNFLPEWYRSGIQLQPEAL